MNDFIKYFAVSLLINCFYIVPTAVGSEQVMESKWEEENQTRNDSTVSVTVGCGSMLVTFGCNTNVGLQLTENVTIGAKHSDTNIIMVGITSAEMLALTFYFDSFYTEVNAGKIYFNQFRISKDEGGNLMTLERQSEVGGGLKLGLRVFQSNGLVVGFGILGVQASESVTHIEFPSLEVGFHF